MRFSLSFMVLFLISFFSFSGFAADQKNHTPTLSQAEEQAQEGDYEGAQATYESILKTDPNQETARLGLAQVLYWQGKYEAAIDQYAKILEKNRDQVDALLGTGKAYLALGKERKAQDFFNRAKKIEPANEEARTANPEFGKKASIEILGGYQMGHFSYASDMQGEYQELTINKERAYGFGFNAAYLQKFDQNAFNTSLFGHYYIFENTRVDGGLSFAPQTAVVPQQSYTFGLAQTFWKLTPEIHYIFEDYRQASINTLRPALYLQPFEFLKIGGGYQLQSTKFSGVRHNRNGGFGEIVFTPMEWLTINGYYWHTNNVFEAGRLPTPYVNFKSNMGGGSAALKFAGSYSFQFDVQFESRNNGETSQIYTLAGGYNF